MTRAVHILKVPILRHVLIMLACSLLCSLLGQGANTRHLSKLFSVASSGSPSQFAARAFDLSTDGVAALEPSINTAGPVWLKDALEVKFLTLQWSALLYRTPVLGWLHRLQKLEDGWRTGGLNRWLSLLDFAVEVLLLLMNKHKRCGVDYRLNLHNLSRAEQPLWSHPRALPLLAVHNKLSSRRHPQISRKCSHSPALNLSWTKRHLPGLSASWTKRHVLGGTAPTGPVRLQLTP